MPAQELAGKIVLDTNNYMVWRSAPGQPAWIAHAHQTRTELLANLARARPVIPR